MFVAECMVFSEEDPISPATISLCLSNQGRESQLWSSATHNGPQKWDEVSRRYKTRRETRASSNTNL